DGAGLPASLRMPSTKVAESPEVTKKTSTSSVAPTESSVLAGRVSNSANSAIETSAAAASASGAPSKISAYSAAPPKTENQREQARLGSSSVPMTNSRIVRPRETRAMNSPTKGDH